jgi:N-sulfoglucosamine sulfohydrolase
MINFADIAPTLLDYAGVDAAGYNMHGRSFRSQLQKPKSEGFDTIYASHTFHEIQQPYHMRMIRDRKYKFIWNLNYELTFPIHGDRGRKMADDIKSGKLKYQGKRRIEDFLKRAQYELYDMENDPDEINNLAYDPDYAEIKNFYLQKIHSFQKNTSDPWVRYQGYDELQRVMN